MSTYRKTFNDFKACDSCGGPVYVNHDTISCSSDIYSLFSALRGNNIETFHVLTLSARNRILSNDIIAQGSVNTVHVSPVDILKPAIIKGATAIICVHNHPSGELVPSAEDRRLTERVARASSLMGIRLLDSVIVAAVGYYSFSDAGEL